MSDTIDGSLSFSRVIHSKETPEGKITTGTVFIDVDTPNGVLRVTVDASQFSKALAFPGRVIEAKLKTLETRGAA